MEPEYLISPEQLVEIIGANEIWLNKICMATHTDRDTALDQLIDYSLHLSASDRYPISRKPGYDGFHLWLRRAKRYERNKPTQQTGKGGLVI